MPKKSDRAWGKQSPFIVAGAITAVSFLAVAAYFDYTNYQKDKQVTAALLAKIDELKALTERDPFPNAENIHAAKSEQGRCNVYLQEARKYLASTSGQGAGNIDPASFKAQLENTIFELKRRAKTGKISLPPEYSFTFETQRRLFRFAPGSLEPLAAQVGDIKAICSLLFDAKVHGITAIRRAVVSADDPVGSMDYHSKPIQTNSTVGAIISPYEISFVGFTKELDAVLASLAKTRHGIFVRSLAVGSSSAAAALTGLGLARPGFVDHALLPLNPAVPPNQPLVVSGMTRGLTIVLQEKPLQITLSLEVIRLMPSKQP
jgi:hypothetical protein